MSLEGSHRSPPKGKHTGALKGIAFGALVLAGAAEGSREASEQLNAHILTPSAISEIKAQTQATDAEMSELETQAKSLLIQELARIRNRK